MQQLVIVLTMFAAGFGVGWGVSGTECAEQAAEQQVSVEQAVTREVMRQTDNTIERSRSFNERVQPLIVAGETIMQEVPVYVESPDCRFRPDIVRMYNDTARDGNEVSAD